jgi:hypothetical protein
MSEAELHILKQRMQAGRRAKAARAELGLPVPMGYVRRPSGEVIKDPDAQAQAVIALIFEQFARGGTINGVLQHLVRHPIQLPCRVHAGANRGDLEWHAPNRATLSNLLHHPIYAGASVYGRRPTDVRRKPPGRPATGRRVAQGGEWSVLLEDRLPAYISWAQFERNLHQLEANGLKGQGAIRHGPSLLSGLIVCGRCGHRMATTYGNSGGRLRYNCHSMAINYGQDRCQSLVGQVLDDFISEQVLAALPPAALEISLKALEDVEAEREQVHRHWQQRLERAHYQAERAHRQFDAVEPEHRLVARTLEQPWEQALAAAAQLQAEYARFVAEQPVPLSAAEREAIRRLAGDIPALWQAPTTSAADRQAIIRQLVERVVVTVQGESERVEVQIHWMGGHSTQATRIRPVARLDQLSYYPQLMARVAALHAQGEEAPAIARMLNAEGWCPAKRCETFNAAMVRTLQWRQGLRRRQSADSSVIERAPGEWTLTELAQRLNIPQPTLYRWLRRGRLQGRQLIHADHPLWLIQADELELAKLRASRTSPRTWV